MPLCTLERDQKQPSSVTPTPLIPTQPPTKVHSPGKKWHQHKTAAPSPQASGMPLTKAEIAITPRRNLTSWHPAPAPQALVLFPNRAAMAIEHRRSPSLHLALALAPPTPGLPPINVVAANAPQGRCSLCSLPIQLSHQSHWLYSDCIGTLPRKDIPSRAG